MRKWKCIPAVLLCLCSLLLTACHGSREKIAFETPQQFDATKQYEITFWAKNDTNKNQTKVYEDSIAAFEELYPNIHVNLRLYTDYGKIYNDVITNISTNTTPNVCITYPDHIATYLTGANTVVPLDELLTDKRYGLGGSELRYVGPGDGEIVPEFLQECRIGDNIYALPFMRSTECCYVNKTYVEKLGFEVPQVLTWEYIWEVSEAATAKGEDGTYLVNGQQVMIPFIYKSTDNCMIQYLRQSGSDYSNAKGEILLFHDTTKNFLYEISEHVKSGAFSTFKISSYPANFLNAGQCIFAVDSTAGSTWMGTHAPLSDISADKVVDFETVVRPVPQVDPEHIQMISQGPSVCIFQKADTQEVLASWLFAQFLLTDEVQIGYAMTEGYVPVTSCAQEASDYQQYLSGEGMDSVTQYPVKLDASKLLLSHTGNTFVTPVFNGSASLRDAAGQLIENVAKATRRKQTIDDKFLQKQFEEVTALYHLNPEGMGAANGKVQLGELPPMAKGLLITLAVAWLFIIIYLISERIRSCFPQK